MSNSEKILKTLSELIEKSILTSKDIKKGISTDFKFKKDKIINDLNLVTRNEFEVLKKIVQNQDIIIHGDGSQTRCFCHVSDVANAFTLALERAEGEIINVGNNSEPISIKDLALKIIKLTNSKSELKFQSFEESKRNRNEIMKRMPDIEKAQMKLDYKPTISLEDGIMKVVNKINST